MITYKSYITPSHDTNLKLKFFVEAGLLETDADETFTFASSTPVSGIVGNPTFEYVAFNQNNTDTKLVWEYQVSTDNTTFSAFKNVLDTTAFTEVISANMYYRFKATLPGIDTSEKFIIESITLNGVKNTDVENNYLFVLPAADVNKYFMFKPAFIFKVFSITGVTIESSDNSILSAYFRYSDTNGRSWTNWFILNNDNLKSIKFNPLRFTLFEFSFANTSMSDELVVSDVNLIGEYQNITLNYQKSNKIGLKSLCFPVPPTDSIDGGVSTPCGPGGNDNCSTNNVTNLFNPDCFPTSGSYNPYNTGQLANLYNYLNQTNTQIFGHTVTYFKQDPDKNGTDFMLHEYQLTNVIKKQDIKVLVPDNVFPDNQIKFNAFNLDLFESFEIHITKDEFKNYFGIEERPGAKDYIYFCDLNRLYEVEHVIHDKTVLNTSTYYKVILKKYTQDASVNWSDTDAKNAIEAITLNSSLDNLFGSYKDTEQKDVSKTTQFLPLSKEKVARNIQTRVKQVPYELLNASLAISASVYDIPYRMNDFAVNYGVIDNVLTTADNRSFIAWFKLPSYATTYDITLFSNAQSNIGYSAKIFNNKLTFKINSTSYELPSIGLEVDTWYCVNINVNQLDKKINMRILTRQTESNADTLKDSILVTHAYIQLDYVPVAFNHSNNLYLAKIIPDVLLSNTASYFVTNFRILSQIVEDSVMHKVLNEYIIKDESAIVLIDNAEEKIILPNYGII